MIAYNPDNDLTPIPLANYVFARPSIAEAKGQAINLAAENDEASKYLQMNKDYLLQQRFQLIIVPKIYAIEC